MSLTSEQLKARDGKLTGSVVGCLMSENRDKQMSLWRELIGDPTFKRDDLRGVWAVQLGSETEQLNLDWYERKTHHEVTRRGEVVVDAEFGWMAATLDGYDSVLDIPVEAKHVGGWEPRATIVERYTPQCMWQMRVLAASTCALSIIEGARAPVIETIVWNEAYAVELVRRAEIFMQHVWAMTPPAMESQ